MKVTFTHRLEVRFRDCDPLGHVNNAVYLTYLEQARFSHWRALWGFRRLPRPKGVPGGEAEPTPGVILARAEIDYRIPARDGDVLEVRLGVSAIGRTSFSYDYEIVDQAGRIVAMAKSVQVMYDYTAGTPVPVPDYIRELLTRTVAADGGVC